jgi:histidinol phosphatase-like enzyme
LYCAGVDGRICRTLTRLREALYRIVIGTIAGGIVTGPIEKMIVAETPARTPRSLHSDPYA